MKRSLLHGIAAAAAASAPVFLQYPAQAACINTDCNSFEPTTATSFVSVAGTYTGSRTAFDGDGHPSVYDGLQIRFTLAAGSGSWAVPVALTGFAISGTGFSGITFSPTTVDVISTGPIFFTTGTFTTPQASLDYSNAVLSFTIPGLEATSGATITSTLRAFNNNGSLSVPQFNSSSFVQTAFTPTPGPLPLFGAGAAFGFSRSLRRRIKVVA